MTLKEILERLYSPTEHAITLKNGELTATSVGVDSKENILKLLEK